MCPYVGVPKPLSPPPHPSNPEPSSAPLSLSALASYGSRSPSADATLRPISPGAQVDELQDLGMPNSGEDLEMPLASPIIPAVDPPADPVPVDTPVSLLP
jgi:hypothetical protein